MNGDLSFMRYLRRLEVGDMVGNTLVIPPSVVGLVLNGDCHDATVSGTKGLTQLNVHWEGVSITPCPNLRELEWRCKYLSDNVPFSWVDLTALSALTIFSHSICHGFRFPQNLVKFHLSLLNQPFDVALLTPLKKLQHLDISLNTKSPLDFSGLESLTELSTENVVSRLPTSLVQCTASVRSDFDFSAHTNLTSLFVWPIGEVRLTFPHQLKLLEINTHSGSVRSSNLSELNLDSYGESYTVGSYYV